MNGDDPVVVEITSVLENEVTVTQQVVAVEVTQELPIEVSVAVPGIQGPPGPPGDPGVHVGPTPPSDTNLLWVDTSV